MQLLLNAEMTIRELNRAFQKSYPCLKLEFYVTHPLRERTAAWNEKLSYGTKLHNVVRDFQSAAVEIETTDTVAELEQKFLANGFFVKLFHRNHDVWLETTQSSHLQLRKQIAVCQRRFMPTYNTHTLFL